MTVDLDNLLGLAGRGWRLFPTHGVVWSNETWRCTCGRHPCGKDNRNAGKHPRVREWEKHATWDVGTIERWHRRWPASNWAVACGATRDTCGLVVADIDTPANARTLAGLMEQHGERIDTLQATTGRGRHVYFGGNVGGSHTVGADRFLWRGEGGYVILPGSRHYTGAVYGWVDPGAPLASLPDWLRHWIVTAGGSRQVQHVAGAETRNAAAVDLGTPPPWVAHEVEDLTGRALACLAPEHSFSEVIQALQRIPSDCSMETWLNVARALHDWDAGEIGLKTFKAWSARSTNPAHADGQEVAEKEWARIKNHKPGKRMIHIASLFVEAERHSPTTVDTAVQTPAITEFPKQINGAHSDFAADAGGIAPIVFPDREKGGKAKATCRNARVAIRGLSISCEHDTFHNKMLVGGRAIDQWAGELSDDATQMLRVVIERSYGFDPGLQNAHDAAVQECLQRAFDPVADYLESLRWDGRSRVATWLTTLMGAPDTPLTRAIGTLALVAAVRRVRVPGTKFDQIIVLESPEGRGKSSAIETLAGAENFSDQLILTLDDKGQQEAVQGVWLYEIGDLAGMGRADVERVKAFASRKVDRARPAYGRARVDRARRCVFFATTNDDTYLLSQTGNRRFWPVRVGRIDLDGLARERDQLWAEAVAIERSGISLVLPERLWGEAAAEQETRQVHDAWIDLLAGVTGKECPRHDGTEGTEWRIMSTELFTGHLGIAADRITVAMSKRLAYTMRFHMWNGPHKFKMDSGASVRGYWKIKDGA